MEKNVVIKIQNDIFTEEQEKFLRPKERDMGFQGEGRCSETLGMRWQVVGNKILIVLNA